MKLTQRSKVAYRQGLNVIVFAASHFAVIVFCLIGSAKIWIPFPTIDPPTDLTPYILLWMGVILSMPLGLVFLPSVLLVDWHVPIYFLPFLLIANSLLWGFLFACLRERFSKDVQLEESDSTITD